MNTQSFSHVTLQSLENYHTAASQAVVAYRVGSHRLLDAVNGALKNRLYPRTAKLAPRATDRMDEVRGSVSQIMVKGIDQMADQAEKAIKLSSTTAAAQLNKAADFASGIDNPVLANGLQAAARVSLPGAKLALAVSSRVADGAQALADAAGARSVHAVKQTVAKTARKVTTRAKTTVSPVAPAVRRAKAQVEATVKSTAKAVTKATNRRVAKLAEAAEAPVAKAQAVARRAKKATSKAMAA